MQRYKRILGIFLVNLAIFSTGVVIIELLYGAWLNPKNLNRLNLIKDETLEYAVSGLYETASPIIKYSRDKYGLRGEYGDDPSQIDLLTVGGSTTDQRYISDDSTWQSVLQNQFASIGAPMVVANAGVDGQSTFGHIKNFDWWFPYVPGLKPRFILFYIGLNDFYKDENADYDALVDPGRHSLVATIRENSALWHLARTIKGAYRATVVLKIGHRKVDFAMVQWTREPLQNSYAFMSSRLDAYAQRLRILVDRTRKFNSEAIFVTQPSRQFRLTKNGVYGRADVTTYDGHQINGVDYYYMIKQFNSVMEAVCRERQVLLIDLAAETEWEDGDFYDFAHMNPRGARKVGRYLFERLRAITNAAELGAPPDKE
jgi:GDSL-like Lipase/Acylhydrolase family